MPLAKVAFEAAEAAALRGDHHNSTQPIKDLHGQIPAGHLARAYLVRAWAHLEQRYGNYDEAVALLDRTLEEGANADDPPEFLAARERIEVALRGLRGFIEVRRGRADRGWQDIRKAVDYEENLLIDSVPEAPFDPSFLLTAWHRRIEFLTSTDQYQRATRELEQLLDREKLFVGASLRQERLRFGIILAATHMELGYPPEPIRLSLEQVLENENLSVDDRLQAALRLAHLELRANQPNTALELVQRAKDLQAVDPSLLDRSFLLALESRARSATSRTRSLAEDELHSAVSGLLQQWSALEPSLGGVAPLRHLRERFILSEHLRLLAAQEGERAALEQLVRVQMTSTLARSMTSKVPTIGEIQSSLVPDEGGLVIWFAGADELHTFLVDGEKVESVQSPLSVTITGLGRSYARLKATSPGPNQRIEQIDLLGRQIQDQIFPNALIEKLSKWKAVTFVGQDFLGSPGLASLKLPQSSLPLGISHAICSLPSLPVGLALAKRRTEIANSLPTPSIALLADVSANPDQPDIPQDIRIGQAGINALTRDFLPDSRFLWTGTQAKPEVLLSHNFGDYGLLQVFAHGIRDDIFEIPAGVQMSPSTTHTGRVFGPDLLESNPAIMAALAVCSAGRGPERPGDASSSDLSGALLRAGSLVVCTGAADLEVFSTHQLFVHLNSALAQGHSPAEALRRARAKIYDAGLSDPFEYALVRLTGLGHLPIFSARPSTSLLWSKQALACLLVLAMLVWLLVRKRLRTPTS